MLITPNFEQGQTEQGEAIQGQHQHHQLQEEQVGAKEQGHHLVQDEGEASLGDPLHHQPKEGREQDHHHHQLQLLHLQGDGAGTVGDKAVQSACSNGMPGSIVPASPGGTSPRTLNSKTVLITPNFEQGQTGEIDQGHV